MANNVKEEIEILEIAPNQRYRRMTSSRSESIAALLEVFKGKTPIGGYVDDLHAPTISSQFSLGWLMDPSDLTQIPSRDRPEPGRQNRLTQGALVLQGSGILLSTDESLKTAKADEVESEQRLRMLSSAQQHATFETARAMQTYDAYNRAIWILFIVVIVAALGACVFLLPVAIDMVGGFTGGFSFFGGGESTPTPTATPVATP